MTSLLVLIKNALEATMLRWQNEDDIPPVTILISQCENKVVLRIHDEGIGISPNDMEKVFF
jgi:sensor histidine kinase regulating citrate/malate metabolism